MRNRLTNQSHLSLSQLKTNQRGLSHRVPQSPYNVFSHVHKIRTLGSRMCCYFGLYIRLTENLISLCLSSVKSGARSLVQLVMRTQKIDPGTL